MGSLARKMRRKKQLQQEKIAKKKLNGVLNVTRKMSDKCVACSSDFDRNAEGALDNWHVVYDGNEHASLYCGQCWEMSHGV